MSRYLGNIILKKNYCGRDILRPRNIPYGKMNISGANIERIRKSKGMKQAELVAKMQLMGVDINLSSMSKLEGQVRAISDIELKAISQILKVTMEELVATERDRG